MYNKSETLFLLSSSCQEVSEPFVPQDVPSQEIPWRHYWCGQVRQNFTTNLPSLFHLYVNQALRLESHFIIVIMLQTTKTGTNKNPKNENTTISLYIILKTDQAHIYSFPISALKHILFKY